ncbi:MAG: YfcE family phosphodiesterase [Promethearchaeota archaeon]
MVKLGIISDTHIVEGFDEKHKAILLREIKQAFKGVDAIVHAGDVCDQSFITELNQVAPTKCVKGNMDSLDLEDFIKFTIGDYNIGVIHEPPNDIEAFVNQNNLHILIHGHTHQPTIKGTPYNALIINPGSTTFPKAPPKKFGFQDPIARPSVITLEIDEDNLLKTYIINLKI